MYNFSFKLYAVIMKITNSDSLISETKTFIKLYEEDGYVHLLLKDYENPNQKTLDIATLIRLGSLETLNIITNDPNTLLFTQIHRYRELIDLLHRNNYLSNSDRADIEAEVLAVEKTLENREKIADQDYSLAQKEVLLMITEPYIEELINLMQELADFIPIRNAFRLLNGFWNLMKWHTKKYNAPIPEETRECYVYLSEILTGGIDISSTYLRLGNAIPSLKIQKNIVLNFFEEKVKIKFPFEQNEYKRFYVELALEKIKNDQCILKRISNKYEINDFTGFPEENLFKPVEISGKCITRHYFHPDPGRFALAFNFFVKKNHSQLIELSSAEEDLLIKFELKRFPISELDFPLAKTCAPSLMKDLNEVVSMIDGGLNVTGMTKLEELLFAILENDAEEIEEIVASAQIDLNAITAFNPLKEANTVETLNVLVRLGCDPNRLDQDNQASWSYC